METPSETAKRDVSQDKVIDGKLVAYTPDELARTDADAPALQPTEKQRSTQRAYLVYVYLPLVFLTVALLGGVRLSDPANSLIFLKPVLSCLVFASFLIVLFYRARLIRLEDWFSEDFPTGKNIANAAVMFSLFAATTQLFNSLLPEQGLPFWVVAFCFLWTLWNNLFADFDTPKLLKSLGGLFGLAFVVKYLLLANLTAPADDSWFGGIWQNPGKEAFTWLLDLPRFSAGTGYIQFFTVVLYLGGLYMLPASTRGDQGRSST